MRSFGRSLRCASFTPHSLVVSGEKRMDAQLILLQEIKTAVWVLIYLVGAGVLLSLLRAVAASYRTIKSELANAFTNTATSMFERGKYEALIKYCLEHLEKNPKGNYSPPSP